MDNDNHPKGVKSIDKILKEGYKEDKLDLIKSKSLAKSQVDYIIGIKDPDLIIEMFYSQFLSDDQLLEIFKLDNYELSKEMIELQRDELNLSDTLIYKICKDPSLKFIRDELAANYPLPQKLLNDIISTEIDNINLIESIVEYQALTPKLISDNFAGLSNLFSDDNLLRVLKFLISHQILPDNMIEKIIDDKRYVLDLIFSQPLSDNWLKYFLNKPEWENVYYTLCEYQTFSQDIVEFIFNMGRDSFLYSVVRLQQLSNEHIERILNTGYASVIEGILKNQDFSKTEREMLKTRFPEYVTLIDRKKLSGDHFWAVINRRNRRDGYLKQKYL